MRIVIQDRAMRLFLKEGNDWTNRLEEAVTFRDEKEAENFCTQNGLRDVFISVRYGEDGMASFQRPENI